MPRLSWRRYEKYLFLESFIILEAVDDIIHIDSNRDRRRHEINLKAIQLLIKISKFHI
jgi:hypothetical protein